MIIRTYKCDDCGDTFEVTHESGDEPDADCPYCKIVMQWTPTSFNIGTVKGKAVDIAQKIAEEDFGLSNMNDGAREGDVAFKPPSPQTTVEREKETQLLSEIQQQTKSLTPPPPPGMEKAVQGFWGGGQGPSNMAMQGFLSAAKMGPGSEVNAMDLLHKAGKAGQLPSNYRIIAKASG